MATEQPAFTSDDALVAFNHFMPVVDQLAVDGPTGRGDVELARANVVRGVEALRPHLARLPTILPQTPVNRLLELPALALGLVHAASRVPAATTGDIDSELARIGPKRELGLSYLEIVEELGLIPAGRARAIRKGNGKIDKARDCVAIAGVFHEHAAALENKHPFAADFFTDLATTGTWLVQTLSPAGAAKGAPARHPAAILADKFWKQVEADHNELRTAGVVIWGIKNVDDHVPPLLSRVAVAKREAAADGAAAGATGDGTAVAKPGA